MNTRNTIIAFFLGILPILFFITSFFISGLGPSNGNGVINLIILSCGSLLISFLLIRTETETHPFPPYILKIIVLFLLICMYSLFMSIDVSRSLYDSVRWILGITLFMNAGLFFSNNRDFIKPYAYAVVIGGVIVCALGISSFIHPLNPGYLRFTSVFFQHNTFGDYLLLPFFIAYGLFLYEKKYKMIAIAGLSLAIIGGSLILTFSRGTWASIVAALIIGGFFFRSHTYSLCNKKILIRFLFIILGSSLIAGTLFYTALTISKTNNTSLGIYNGEVAPGNSTKSRIEYDRDALRILFQNPLGVGLDNYRLIAQATRDQVAFFSFDPHNIYLKFAVETGILGGIIFILFLYSIFVPSFKTLTSSIQKQYSYKPIVVSMAFGTIAVLIHNAVDMGFSYTVNLIVFFTTAGVLYGVTSPHSYSFTSKIIFKIIILAQATALIVATLFFIAQNAFDDAEYFKEQKRYDEAFTMYKRSHAYMPFISQAYYGKGELFYINALTLEDKDRLAYLKGALDETNKAIDLSPRTSIYYDAQSKIYLELGEIEKGLDSLKKAVELDPLNNLDKHIDLAHFYMNMKQYDNAIALIVSTVKHYPHEIFESSHWADPSRELWRGHVGTLYAILEQAYKAQGNTEAALHAHKESVWYIPTP